MSESAIRLMQISDIDGVVALQSACFPPPFPAELLWRPEHIAAHLSRFPEGQWVAEVGGAIVGSASACLISEPIWNAHCDWETTVGGWDFSGHDPAGTTLFGADISVHPEFRGQGIGRALYGARFAVVRDLGVVRFGTACRMPDYREWTERNLGSRIEDYAQAVVNGEQIDRTLTPLLRYGLTFVGIAHGHMEDSDSGSAAAILEWKP